MNPFASLDRVRVVMSHTTHPGNIGACARAMKLMGLSRLYLVNPGTGQGNPLYISVHKEGESVSVTHAKTKGSLSGVFVRRDEIVVYGIEPLMVL